MLNTSYQNMESLLRTCTDLPQYYFECDFEEAFQIWGRCSILTGYIINFMILLDIEYRVKYWIWMNCDEDHKLSWLRISRNYYWLNVLSKLYYCFRISDESLNWSSSFIFFENGSFTLSFSLEHEDFLRVFFRWFSLLIFRGSNCLDCILLCGYLIDYLLGDRLYKLSELP